MITERVPCQYRLFFFRAEQLFDGLNHFVIADHSTEPREQCEQYTKYHKLRRNGNACENGIRNDRNQGDQRRADCRDDVAVVVFLASLEHLFDGFREECRKDRADDESEEENFKFHLMSPLCQTEGQLFRSNERYLTSRDCYSRMPLSVRNLSVCGE